MERKWLPAALVLAVLAGMGLATRHFGLVYDSRALLTRHPVITGAASLEDAFSRPYLDRLGDDRGLKTYYRPLPLLSFALGHSLWNLSPGIERGINLGLFGLWLGLVYALVFRREGDRPLAAMVMLFCAAFPLNWDNVSWVAGRPDLFVLVFATTTLLLLEQEPRRRHWNGGLALILFSLALLSKESAFFFLPLLVLPMGRRREPGWVTRGGFVFLALVAMTLRHGATGFWGVPGARELHVGEAIIRLVGAAGVYARSLLFPFGVSPYLPPEWTPGLQDLFLGTVLLVLMAWMVFRWWTHRRERLPVALVLVFLSGHLLAVLSDLSLSVAPRFLTWPFLGFSWWVLKTAGKHPPIRRLVATALLLLLLPFVPLQAAAYRSNLVYWQRMRQAYPESVHFSLQLAREYVTEGRFMDAEALLVDIKPKPGRDFNDSQLLLANVDLARADYPSLQRRLQCLQAKPLDEATETSALRLRARMHLLRGEEETAFSMMKALIRRRLRAEWVREFHRMLLGRLRWRRARNLEESFASRGVQFPRKADEWAAEFRDMSETERIHYFTGHWNPRGALSVLMETPPALQNTLQRAGMLYFCGDPESAASLLADASRAAGKEKEIGIWYLESMQRPREALRWFRRALEKAPRQSEVERLVRRLESWPHAPPPCGGKK